VAQQEVKVLNSRASVQYYFLELQCIYCNIFGCRPHKDLIFKSVVGEWKVPKPASTANSYLASGTLCKFALIEVACFSAPPSHLLAAKFWQSVIHQPSKFQWWCHHGAKQCQQPPRLFISYLPPGPHCPH
jgi:hypothetical protein